MHLFFLTVFALAEQQITLYCNYFSEARAHSRPTTSFKSFKLVEVSHVTALQGITPAY
jgi:hypothetical protein